MNRCNSLWLVLLLLLFCGGLLFSQSGTVLDNSPVTPPAPEVQTQQPQTQPQPTAEVQTQQQTQPQPQPTAVQTEKQKAFTQDTQELLKLATELNDAVNRTTQNTLSVGVIRKAEEIEKLAKKMKTN